jgi:hypothetical protein
MSKYVLKKIEVIPEGYYPVTITKVEEATGEFGQQEKFTLSLPGNRELLAWASASYTTKSKLYKWVRAVLFSGGSVPEDYELDTQDFIGKQAIAHITVRINTKGDNYNKVEDLLLANIAQPPQANLFGPDVPPQAPPIAGGQSAQPGQNLSQWTQNIS